MVAYDAAHTAELKKWLSEQLDGICDADPEVLSDYVLALLKHEVSDDALSGILTESLEDFLAEHTEPFVKLIIGALKDQSYLPAASRKRQASEAPAASSSQLPSAAASVEGTGAESGDGPSSSNGTRQSHRGGDRDRERDGKRRKGDGAGEIRRGLCRDYHQKGWCSRGAECRFQHSTDVVNAAGNGTPNHPHFTPNGPIPMMLGAGPIRLGGPGGAPQPFGGMQQPFAFSGPMPRGPWPGPGQPGFSHAGSPRVGPQMNPGGPPDQAAGPGMGAQMPPNFPPQQQQQSFMPDSAGMPGRPVVGGRGGGHRQHQGTFRQRKSETALVVENIPPESLELIKVNEFFKRFGTITNIQIDVPGKKALVEYSRPDEAKAAISCPDAVLGNRFVKVFFQRFENGSSNGQPASLPAASAAARPRPPPPEKSAFVVGQNQYHAPGMPVSAGQRAKLIAMQHGAQRKVDHLLGEQKTLMAAITSPLTSTEAKKASMTRMKAIEGELGAATTQLREAIKAVQSLPPPPPAEDPAKRKEMKEKAEREQMDRELDMHSRGETSESTEELKAKLEKLREEAAAIGLDANGTPTHEGGYRGRGRGRGTYFSRGRGAYGQRPSMRLDNRTTKLVVSDVPTEHKEQVKEHYKQFGEVEDIYDSSPRAFIITYKARPSGEAAMRASTEIATVGTVKLAWAAADAGPQAQSVSAASGAPSSSSAQASNAMSSSMDGNKAVPSDGEAEEGEEEDWRPA
ncbi:hypothetical protein IE81DRAFT_320289 [Ceraceosorus guamensis]|uniref:C3H1-type domain-containing protein n=1 Tax=Ceraceosorus guamensis TaxID=1522189 RepID=A0A316W6N1_9BASI|nr:hypothetical protein IE81DRAFT_320289 [Ceraceosorus guamensis]PWN45527.1 hypothetical protein IE81DRAFT_320289 [Ceraceosorus guamensis]